MGDRDADADGASGATANPRSGDRGTETDDGTVPVREQPAGSEATPDPANGDDLARIRQALITWYDAEHRPFPWRETTDPYEILVCEVMSQQTQLDRVADAWESFLQRWPTVEALAGADRADVVGFWSDHSLGYNNRAGYLHEAAQQIVAEWNGEVPRTPDGLQELAGVGPYTANAVASFAFNEGAAVVDTNVRRVLHRAFDVPDDEGAFEQAANDLLPEGTSRVWNNAVMELGGVVCRKTPLCDQRGCPWRRWCDAYATGDFTAPDVSTQPPFEGSRRQMRGRIVATLGDHGELEIDALGRRIRVDYVPEGEHGRTWLRQLLADLADDGLVTVDEAEPVTARLRR